jgi:ATP-dependent Clp protease ATP-binding subunit ClpC
MFKRFSDCALEAIAIAQKVSSDKKHNYIGTEHILYGILEANGQAVGLLRLNNVSIEEFKERITFLESSVIATPKHIPFTPTASLILKNADEIAANLGHEQVTTNHIFLSLLQDMEGQTYRLAQQFDFLTDNLLNQLKQEFCE